jgi:hypothetical protein
MIFFQVLEIMLDSLLAVLVGVKRTKSVIVITIQEF